MSLKIHIHLKNVVVIEAISTVRGNVKIKVPSLNLQKEFRFELKNSGSLKEAVTVFKDEEKYADSITAGVAIHGLKKGASPQIHITSFVMIGIARHSQGKGFRTLYLPPPDMLDELPAALREGLQ